MIKFWSKFTNTNRHRPKLQWSKRSLVYNLFRIYEWVFGKELIPVYQTGVTKRHQHGKVKVKHYKRIIGWTERIRKEGGLSVAWDEKGRVIFAKQRFYTLENRLVTLEYLLFVRWIDWIVNFARWLVLEVSEATNFGFQPVGFWQRAYPVAFGLAIALDNSGKQNDATGTNTFSFTQTGSNMMLAVGILGATTAEGGDDLTGVTYAGTTVPNVNKLNTQSYRWTYLNQLAGGATGANNLVSSWTNSHFNRFDVESFSGCAQSGQPDSSNTANAGTVQTLTQTTTVVASNCWLSAYFINTAGAVNITAGAGTTMRGPSGETQMADSNGTVGTGSQSLIGNNTSNANWQGVIMSIAPVVVTTTSTSSTTSTTTTTTSSSTTTTTTTTSSSTTTTSSSTTSTITTSSSTTSSTTTTSSSTTVTTTSSSTTTTSSSTTSTTTTTSSSTTSSTTTSSSTSSTSTTTTTSSSTTSTTSTTTTSSSSSTSTTSSTTITTTSSSTTSSTSSSTTTTSSSTSTTTTISSSTSTTTSTTISTTSTVTAYSGLTRTTRKNFEGMTRQHFGLASTKRKDFTISTRKH